MCAPVGLWWCWTVLSCIILNGLKWDRVPGCYTWYMRSVCPGCYTPPMSYASGPQCLYSSKWFKVEWNLHGTKHHAAMSNISGSDFLTPFLLCEGGPGCARLGYYSPARPTGLQNQTLAAWQDCAILCLTHLNCYIWKWTIQGIFQ